MPRALGDVEQRLGADPAEPRMIPARQRFRADEAAIGAGKLRLEKDLNLSLADRRVQLLEPLAATTPIADTAAVNQDFRREHDAAVAQRRESVIGRDGLVANRDGGP